MIRGPGLLLGIILVCCVVAAVHWPVLSAQALCFDDREFLSDNPLVQNPSLENAGRFLQEVCDPSTVGGYYIPLTMISLMVDCALGGRPDDLGAFHWTNLILHLLTTAAIAVLLTLLFKSPWIALMFALLFGLHPLTVEPVAWIGERKTVLATCLAVWAMSVHVFAVRRGDGKLVVRIALIAAATILFAFSLLAKPTTITLPVLLLLLDIWPLGRFGRKAILEKGPYFVVAGVMAVLTVLSNARGGEITVAGHVSQGPLPLRICHNLMLYATNIVIPTGLTPYYPPPDPFDLTHSAVLAGLLGTAVLLVFLIVSLRWTRRWVVGCGFFLIAISPTLGFIQYSWILASDKYVYFPVIGLLLLVSCYAGKLWNDPPQHAARRPWRTAVLISVAVVALLWSLRTRDYLGHWRDSESLYRYMLSVAPDAPVLHYSLANALEETGRDDEALAEYAEAVRTGDPYADPHVGIGKILYERNEVSGAIEQFQAALRIDPNHLHAHDNLGAVLSGIGRTEEAAVHLKEAIRINPRYASPYYNLGMNLQRQGRQPEAVEQYRQALRADPGFYQAHANLASLLEKMGQLPQAVAHYREALRLSGGHPAVQRRLREAERALEARQRRGR